jgi:hypothetical protein
LRNERRGEKIYENFFRESSESNFDETVAWDFYFIPVENEKAPRKNTVYFYLTHVKQ